MIHYCENFQPLPLDPLLQLHQRFVKFEFALMNDKCCRIVCNTTIFNLLSKITNREIPHQNSDSQDILHCSEK